MGRISIFFRVFLILGIISLFNIVNLNFGDTLKNAQAQDLTSDLTSAEPLTSSPNPYNPNQIPYFQSVTIEPASDATTITVTNKWNTPILAEIKSADDGSAITSLNIAASSSAIITFTPTSPVDLTISANDKDGFRNWISSSNPLISASGISASNFESFNQIPDLRYFTSDSSGTQAGNYFFSYFFSNTQATSLPVGSFDTSNITKAGLSFFEGFLAGGSLTSLPENSFDTSNITTAGSNFFRSFNYGGSLTSLPRYSFNFDSLLNHGTNAFSYFNYSGSLTSLPYNSFNLKNVTIAGADMTSWGNFNNLGALTKEDKSGDDSSGIIRNTSSTSQTFYWTDGTTYSAGSQNISSGSTFSAYKSDPALTFTISFDSNGGSVIYPVTALQGEKFIYPINPTKSGYRFIQWLYQDGTPFNWTSKATENLTLTAQWELPDFEQIPYFQTETVTELVTHTFTLTNKWTNPILAEIKSADDGSTISSYNLAASTSSTIEFTPTSPIDLTISANTKNGFRTWGASQNPLIRVSGSSASEFSSFTRIPEIRYFTTDSSGTQAGNYFFYFFLSNSKATTLPAGSFDISTITKVGISFFHGFNNYSNLVSLPEGSFDTSNITTASTRFFQNFNYGGKLTSLPRYSFNFDSLQTHGDYAFNFFNFTYSLTSLPYNSFNLNNVTIAGSNNNSWGNFNFYGGLAKEENGISIRNTSTTAKDFYWRVGSTNQSQNIASGASFVAYKSDTPATYSIFYETNGGSTLDATTTIQGEKFPQPADPIKPGYQFIQWVYPDGTPFDWDFTATSNVTLYAQWEDVNLLSVPYFQTKTIPVSTSVHTITITNRWNSTITAEIKSISDRTNLTSTIIPVSSAATITFTPSVSVDLTISAENRSGFRSWQGGDTFIQASGPSASRIESFAHIPDIRYFTTDSSGTEAGNSFFTNFFKNTKTTSLPAGSFDISTITKAGDSFFYGFNQNGSLQSLPFGSFNTSNIREAGDYFFTSFNQSGSLTSLPYNSFNLNNVDINETDVNSLSEFNEGGLLTKVTEGIQLKNISSDIQNFYWAENSTPDAGSIVVESGSSFAYYKSDPAPIFTLSFNTNGGSNINAITTIQGQLFTRPANPTKSGYRFIQWVDEYGTPFDWTAIPTSDITLYAQWELIPNNPNNNAVLNPVITNISPKQVENGKAAYVILTGSNLNAGTYSFKISSSRAVNSNLPSASKTFNQIYPSSSIVNRTNSTATLKIPTTVPWVGSYTIELLKDSGTTPTKTVVTYQLTLGSSKTFLDISKLSSSRQDSVKWLARVGVTAGCGSAGTHYCPEDPVNRGSMAAFLQSLAGYPAGSANTSSFADVFSTGSKTITYISGSNTTEEVLSALSPKRIAAINWLAQTGVTGGSGSAKVNGKLVPTYRPQDLVNRGSMASFMLKFSEEEVPTLTSDAQTEFADIKIGSGNFTITYAGSSTGETVAKLSASRATAIKWMKTAGITGGSGSDINGHTTYRAQDVVNRGSMASFMKNLATYLKFTS